MPLMQFLLLLLLSKQLTDKVVMNIILFSLKDKTKSDFFAFSCKDKRYLHIKNILHLAVGESFRAGLINGMLGSGNIIELNEKHVLFKFESTCRPKPLHSIRMILGISRPIQLKRTLKDLTTLGVEKIHLVGTVLGEKSYMSSTLLSTNEIEKYFIEGASQAGSTLLPFCDIHTSLHKFFSSESGQNMSDTKLLFDLVKNAHNAPFLSHDHSTNIIEENKPIYIAIGSERGWSEGERELFLQNDFRLITLGDRILRVETATIATVSYVLTKTLWSS